MAAYSASNLVAAQIKAKEKFQSPEFRQKPLVALSLGLANSDPYLPNAQEVRKREDRTIETYIQKRVARSVGSQRTATHTGTAGDSLMVPITWNTYSVTSSQSLKQQDNNIYSADETLATVLYDMILALQTSIETDTITNLLAARTQTVLSTNPVASRAAWNATNYAYEIGNADKSQFYQLAKIIMAKNNYGDSMFDIIADASKYVDAQFYASQGTGNATNTAFQFAGMNPLFSTDLTDANYVSGLALVMPMGTYGLIPWIPIQNRNGVGDMDSYVGGYGSMADPVIPGLTYAMHGYTTRTDASGVNGSAQDNMLQLELSVDIAFVKAPLSTSGESTIFEIGQL